MSVNRLTFDSRDDLLQAPAINSMNDAELAKKELEQHDLMLFLREYQRATGSHFVVMARRERPDFEVRLGDEHRGLELVQVMERPDLREFRILFGGREGMTVAEASDGVQDAIYQKEEKRRAAGWAFSDATILVVHLKGASASDLYDHMDAEILDELRATGFLEIWICGHSMESPFGTVELVGLKPRKWEGAHIRTKGGSKPYG